MKPEDVRKLSEEDFQLLRIPEPFRPLRRRTKHYPLPAPLVTPAVTEHFTRRPHRFKCPACERVYFGVYRPDRPLPVCMGSRAALHPRWMLVSEVWDEYQHMLVRLRRGDASARPIIDARVPIARSGYRPQEVGTPDSSPRG